MLEITWGTIGSGLAIAIVLLLLVFFKDLREKFKVRVNCWFCNENASVPFAQRNSFVCPSCRQYNGFEEDGSYNKAIPEQYDEMLNSQHNIPKGNKQPAKNGLCKLCNNNQQLKVYQLANFVPMNEDNYDLEIEHFQKQLEKAYELCPKCDTVVKKTIDKQNRWLIGMKMKYLKDKGVKVLQKSRRELSEMQKSHLIFSSLFLMTISSLYFTGCLKKLLMMVLMDVPKIVCMYLQDYGYKNVVSMFEGHSSDYYKTVGESELVLSWICAISLLLSVIYIVYSTKTAINNTANDETNTTNFYKFINTSRHERILQESFSDNEAHNPLDLSSADSDSELMNAKPKKKKWSTLRKSNGEYRHVPVFGENSPIKTPSFRDLHNTSSNLQFLNINKSPNKDLNCSSVSNLNESFTTVKSFNSRVNLNSSLNNLRLGSKPLIAPGKLKNPWTGKYWEADAVSRSSSQSSGFYSYADNCNSICGEFDCSSMISEPVNRNPALFSLENKPKSLNFDSRSVYSCANKFNPIHVNFDNNTSISLENKFRPLSFDNKSPDKFSMNFDNNPNDSSPNKFKPLNVSLDNKSVYSCSTLKPGSIYSVGKKSERTLFSPCRSDCLMDSSIEFCNAANIRSMNLKKSPQFWND